MYRDIYKFIKFCPICQKSGKRYANTKTEIKNLMFWMKFGRWNYRGKWKNKFVSTAVDQFKNCQKQKFLMINQDLILHVGLKHYYKKTQQSKVNYFIQWFWIYKQTCRKSQKNILTALYHPWHHSSIGLIKRNIQTFMNKLRTLSRYGGKMGRFCTSRGTSLQYIISKMY